MRYIHAMEYYSTLERKNILIHATTQTNPEDIVLSEINQSNKPVTKDIYCVIILI